MSRTSTTARNTILAVVTTNPGCTVAAIQAAWPSLATPSTAYVCREVKLALEAGVIERRGTKRTYRYWLAGTAPATAGEASQDWAQASVADFVTMLKRNPHLDGSVAAVAAIHRALAATLTP